MWRGISVWILLAGLLGAGPVGCASLMQAQSARPDPAVFATDDAKPTDIYRGWYLYRQIYGDNSVAGQLALADLSNWRRDQFRSAFYWYTRAAADGNGIAAANLWYMYETVPGGGSGDQQAMGFYQLAATTEAGRRQLYALETKLAIDSQRRYPASGMKAQGTALIEFDRGADDKPVNVKVFRSSGNVVLDGAAMEAVEAASLPAVPSRPGVPSHFVISVKISPDMG